MNHKSFCQLFLVLMLVTALSLGYSATLLAGTCPDGIVAYWGLEESGGRYQDLIDEDSGNTAICSSQCPTRTDGAVLYANRFQGGNTGLQVPSGTAFNWSGSDIFSMELWVRRTQATSDNQVLIGRTDGVFNWNISLRSNGTISFVLEDSSYSIQLTSSKVLSTPQSVLGALWHHVSVVRDGNSGATRLFVDGRMVDSEAGTFGGGFSSSSAPLAIGWSGDESNPQRFIGDLDEIAVYQRVLELDEIRSHYYLSRGYCSTYDYPVNIMPLGDSITFEDSIYHNVAGNEVEYEDRIAYRWDLWGFLNDGMYWVDFIGSREAGENVDPNFDPDNSGYPGISPEGLLYLLQTSYFDPDLTRPNPNVEGYIDGLTSDTLFLPRYPSDVILLHIGTNGLLDNDDVESNVNVAPYVNYVNGILDQIDDYEENITVVVARIIHVLNEEIPADQNSDNSITHQYNDALEAMVNSRIAAGDKLFMVDMEDGAGIDYEIDVDMVDPWHPNETGYRKMAVQWYERLEDFLPQIDPPEITSPADRTADAGSVYRYQVLASGTPKPRFYLENGPANMEIDENTGLITWDVPDNVGATFNVRIVAENIDSSQVSWWGNVTDNQEFDITITAPGSNTNTETETDTVTNTDSDSGSGSSGGMCFIQSAASNGSLMAGPMMAFGAIVSMLCLCFRDRRK